MAITMDEPMFPVGTKLILEVAEIYKTTRGGTPSGRKSEEYVYRMRGDTPLMRERQLRLLERIEE